MDDRKQEKKSIIEKAGLFLISVIFVVGGALYIVWGGPEGEVIPIPQVRAKLWYRLLLGGTLIVAGVMAFLELKRGNDKKRGKNNNA